MNDTGYLILNLESNNLNNDIISYGINSNKNNPFKQDILFTTNSDLISNPGLPILHISQSKFFFGNIFIFDINSILLTSDSPNIKTRFFYATDIPWINTNENYNYWISLFNSDNLQIIAQNQQIFDIYNICWKKPIGISERFDYETINRFI